MDRCRPWQGDGVAKACFRVKIRKYTTTHSRVGRMAKRVLDVHAATQSDDEVQTVRGVRKFGGWKIERLIGGLVLE